MSRKTRLILFFLTAVFATFSIPAHAYLDPGTGSMILQMVVAGLMSAMFVIKLYWYRFKSLAMKLLGKEPKIDERYENFEERQTSVKEEKSSSTEDKNAGL